MKASVKAGLGLLCVVLVFGGAMLFWHIHFRPQPPPSANTQNIADFDALQDALRDRVFKEYGGSDAGNDFQAIVATPDSSIGTLIRAGGSLPADSTDCVPTPMPKAVPHGGLFPDYTVSSSTAITANLGPNAVQALNSGDLSLASNSTLTYKIEDPQIQLLADNSVEDMTNSGNCHQYLQSHSGLRLIRGTVTGKITYIVKVANPSSAKIQLLKDFGNIAVTDDPGSSTVSISDAESQPIVDLLTIFPTVPTPVLAAEVAQPAPPLMERHRMAASHALGSPAPVQASPLPPPPAVPRDGPQVYIQADVLEPVTATTIFAQQFAEAWPQANIVYPVQRVISTKMPNVAQVRFFNSGDQKLADSALMILKRKYPKARTVRIGLSSPVGQLEIWLPKFTGQP